MKTRTIGNWELGIGKWSLGLILLLYAPALAERNFDQAGVSIAAQTIRLSRVTNRIEAVGSVHLEAVNKSAKTSFTADAQRVVVTVFSSAGAKGALRGLDSIKSAQFDGPVKMVYTAPKPVLDKAGKEQAEVMTTTTATADSATFDGNEGIAYLVGHVKIIQDDPSMWAEPAVMTGEKASINLKRAPGAEDYDFKIESTTSPSRIEVVPKAEAKAAK